MGSVDRLAQRRHFDADVDEDEPVTGPILLEDVEPQAPRDFRRGGAAIAETLTFKRTQRPWYRTKKALVALVAAPVLAMVVWVVLLALRGSGSAPQESITPVTSTAPAPTSAAPSPSSAPTGQPVVPPPMPPPPPPPPPSEQAPVVTGSNPRPHSQAPSADAPSEKPQVDVTRTPISVAPSVKPAPGTNSATPGDGRKRWGYW